MREYEIELEIFEGKGGRSSDGTYPSFVEEGICVWMFGDDEDPEYKAGRRSSIQTILGNCVRGSRIA
ncbi:hypothetical protein ACFLSW_01165 [Candidatus Bipolaricaulota bacterium]